MRAWAETGPIAADFSIVGDKRDFEITFESGDGGGRNTQYTDGVELILSRLAEINATLTRARITAKDIEKKSAAMGQPTSFVPAPYELPLLLESHLDVEAVRRALSRVGGKVLSESKGNATKRMTLDVRLAVPMSLEGLVRHVVRRPVGAPIDDLVLTLAQDLTSCDAGFLRWIAVLNEEARTIRPGLRWLAAERVMFAARPSTKRDGAVDVKLGVRSTGEPWAVEINAPRLAEDINGLATIALDEAGGAYLLRQGYLRGNPDSDGDVSAERFRVLSGLVPAEVRGGSTPSPREWYVVADLGAPAEEIRRTTGVFVDACARARELSKTPNDPSPALAVSPLLASGEKGGTFMVRPMEARPAREVRRLQGEVWLALAARLEAAGMKLLKPRHEAGYEVDGLIPAATGGILLEIKTGSTPADIYEGVGQLLIYGSALRLEVARRVLLLPCGASDVLMIAALGHGVEVHTYELNIGNHEVTVVFSDPFLQVCGLAAENEAGVSAD